MRLQFVIEMMFSVAILIILEICLEEKLCCLLYKKIVLNIYMCIGFFSFFAVKKGIFGEKRRRC